MTTIERNVGQRLISTLIDSHAVRNPTRTWAVMPKDSQDLSKGYRDINYQQFANAIDHAAWWLTEKVSSQGKAFETLAYVGPQDLRYPIVAVAAAKCAKKLLLCSPFASIEGQRHLLKVTECGIYIHTPSLKHLGSTLLDDSGTNVSLVEVPELDTWLNVESARPFIYTKTWDEAQGDPWLVFHSSGTTGLPKPIVYTHWMMTSFDAAELMPDAGSETFNGHIRNGRFYCPIPLLHYVGMTMALQWAVFLNMTLLIGPSGPPGPASSANTIEVLEQAKADGAVLPPSMIEEILRQEGGTKALHGLSYLYFAGAPLTRQAAEKLIGSCKIQPAMGSTEAGGYFLEVIDDNDWEYYRFRPSMGVELEPRGANLYELVFCRKPELERWQQLFKLYPEAHRYPTKDLWTPHPTNPNLWRYAGRTDDRIILTQGYDVHASEFEAQVKGHPYVRTAVLGGQCRPTPFLLLDLVDCGLLSKRELDAKLDDIWPFVEMANARCSEPVRLWREHVLFTDSTRPLPLTDKATVMRGPAFALYQQDINNLYVK